MTWRMSRRVQRSEAGREVIDGNNDKNVSFVIINFYKVVKIIYLITLIVFYSLIHSTVTIFFLKYNLPSILVVSFRRVV